MDKDQVSLGISATQKTVMLADVMNHQDLDNVVSEKHFEEETRQTNELLNYIFDNYDAFYLLLTKSAGSTHEHFQEEICDLYTKNCAQTFNWMFQNKIATRKIDKMTVHFIASTVINAFVEIITHKMSKKAAFQYIQNIEDYTRFGMIHMMGIPCEHHE